MKGKTAHHAHARRLAVRLLKTIGCSETGTHHKGYYEFKSPHGQIFDFQVKSGHWTTYQSKGIGIHSLLNELNLAVPDSHGDKSTPANGQEEQRRDDAEREVK